jgi:hypothetical protein
MKIKIKSKLKIVLEFGAFSVLLESPWRVKFLIEFYFTIFRAKVWKISIFLSGFCLLEIQTNCTNWDLEGKFHKHVLKLYPYAITSIMVYVIWRVRASPPPQR